MSNFGYDRIKKILLNDKISAYDGFVEILKSDLKEVLSSYMIVKNITIGVDVKNSNDYVIDIKIDAKDIIAPSQVK